MNFVFSSRLKIFFQETQFLVEQKRSSKRRRRKKKKESKIGNRSGMCTLYDTKKVKITIEVWFSSNAYDET